MVVVVVDDNVSFDGIVVLLVVVVADIVGVSGGSKQEKSLKVYFGQSRDILMVNLEFLKYSLF